LGRSHWAARIESRALACRWGQVRGIGRAPDVRAKVRAKEVPAKRQQRATAEAPQDFIAPPDVASKF